jgi:hypothetical protein
MASYPIEIRRCRHVKTNGTQCGSPAVKGKELCFYHERNRPQPVELYMDGERYCDSQIVLPVFEDAHSIQTVIRQVVQLMLTRRIERKDAGLLLYALQIASGNLKLMQAEKARPTQVVVEPDKAAETPLGMTPWSASGQGHDRDEAEGGEADAVVPPASPEEVYGAMSVDERIAMRKDFDRKGLIRPGEFEDFLWSVELTRYCSRLRGFGRNASAESGRRRRFWRVQGRKVWLPGRYKLVERGGRGWAAGEVGGSAGPFSKSA